MSIPWTRRKPGTLSTGPPNTTPLKFRSTPIAEKDDRSALDQWSKEEARITGEKPLILPSDLAGYDKAEKQKRSSPLSCSSRRHFPPLPPFIISPSPLPKSRLSTSLKRMLWLSSPTTTAELRRSPHHGGTTSMTFLCQKARHRIAMGGAPPRGGKRQEAAVVTRPTMSRAGQAVYVLI